VLSLTLALIRAIRIDSDDGLLICKRIATVNY